MQFHWLLRRQEARLRVLAEADALLREFGNGAYDEARRRVIETLRQGRGDRHREEVRREIGRRIGRVHLDTATRYLEP